MPDSTTAKTSPPVADDAGANLDPARCDCGKGACCPLWTRAWIEHYGAATEAARERIAGSKA